MRTDSLTKKCPACGMHQIEWPDSGGLLENGHLFCCEGCALGTGCTYGKKNAG